MQKVFEKIIEKLEEKIKWYEKHGENADLNRGMIGANRHAVEIVNQEATENRG